MRAKQGTEPENGAKPTQSLALEATNKVYVVDSVHHARHPQTYGALGLGALN